MGVFWKRSAGYTVWQHPLLLDKYSIDWEGDWNWLKNEGEITESLQLQLCSDSPISKIMRAAQGRYCWMEARASLISKAPHAQFQDISHELVVSNLQREFWFVWAITSYISAVYPVLLMTYSIFILWCSLKVETWEKSADSYETLLSFCPHPHRLLFCLGNEQMNRHN